MMTRINDLDEDKHMNMTYIEFLEAIGRLAARLKLPLLVDEGTNKIIDYSKIILSVSYFIFNNKF